MSVHETPDSFDEFCSRFASEESCVESLFRAKWPTGFVCPRCGFTAYYFISSRRLPLYECRSCRLQHSLIAGTIMEGSRTPLRLWFQAIYLHARPQSINALQLSKIIGVTYKTAWLICHKIRYGMSQAESGNLLKGCVHVSDSMYCKRLTPYFDWHPQEQALLVGSSLTSKGTIDQLKIKLQSKSQLKDKYDCPDPATFIRQNVEPSSVPTVVQAYLDQYCYYYNRPQRSVFGLLLTDSAIGRTITYPLLTRSRRSFRNTRSARIIASASALMG
ncbi:transposase [Cohnella soli]|uniref:Transposase n=1 Tax=Cohnella soli TaxID=425005 RepID=A0ABW0HRZ3_9BACL